MTKEQAAKTMKFDAEARAEHRVSLQKWDGVKSSSEYPI